MDLLSLIQEDSASFAYLAAIGLVLGALHASSRATPRP